MSQDKVALVTGASSGIGKETALQLAAHGYHVFSAARRVEKMEEIKVVGIEPAYLDVTSQESINKLVKHIMDTKGRIDVLVNNAGYGAHGALEDVSLDEARRQFDVNVFGLMALTKEVLPAMRKQRSGRIINVSSVVGKMSTPLTGWYSASKHALEALSDALRVEVKPFGIQVVVIEPGAIKTEFSDVVKEKLENTEVSPAYERMTDAWKKSIGNSSNAAPPHVVAEAIQKAATTDNPRTRYAVPFEAKAFLFARGVLGDKVMDRLILRELDRRQKQAN